MPVRTSVAELRIPETGVRLCGTVRAFTPVGPMVALQGDTLAMERLVPGGIVQAALLTPEGLQSGCATIVTRDKNVVVVSLAPARARTERRRLGRRPCRVAVQVRSLAADGQRGAWGGGVAADVSLDGMRFESPADVGASSRLELRFDLWEGPTRQVRAYGDDGVSLLGEEAGHYMRVQASVVWCRQSDSGYSVGVRFRSPTPECRMRLARFVAGDHDDASS